MKVLAVSIMAPAAATERPALTPELLASVGAKYSRSNQGVQKILSTIDPANPDKSIDTIFRHVDYGHQSIADMVPVAMFLDDISVMLAYMIWATTPVQTASGQESSTRYIKLSSDGVIDHTTLGIPDHLASEWQKQNTLAFEAYKKSIIAWESLLEQDQSLTRIPADILEDPSKRKQVARMKRNFVFDRSRVYLPVGAATNMFLLMSARAWVGLCQFLLSSPLREANMLGQLVTNELTLYAPRMVKYAARLDSTAQGILDVFKEAASLAIEGGVSREKEPKPFLDVMLPNNVSGKDLASALEHHENRYSWFGDSLRRTMVRFGWEAVSLAEIRDLNRHLTGSKYCPIIPVGFHSAIDQYPPDNSSTRQELFDLQKTGYNSTNWAIQCLSSGDPSYVYWLLLGSQLPFEHTTTGDKFVYEMELRTGAGSHYRYARHCHDLLELWYKSFPETKGLILEGSAEPE